MKKTSLNLNENTTCLLCYVLGWISGLIIILIEKKNTTVKFHAMQSIIFSCSTTLISILLGTVFMFLLPLLPIFNIAVCILWIVLMVKAYKGEMFKLPIIGDFAEEWSQKVNL